MDNGAWEDSLALTLLRLSLAWCTPLRLGVHWAFVPCIMPISLLTLDIGGVLRPFYMGTGRKNFLKETAPQFAWNGFH